MDLVSRHSDYFSRLLVQNRKLLFTYGFPRKSKLKTSYQTVIGIPALFFPTRLQKLNSIFLELYALHVDPELNTLRMTEIKSSGSTTDCPNANNGLTIKHT